MESARILGQNHIRKHLENAIKMGKISHAYIINGEEGTGKMTLAVEFAKALQCVENNPEFYGTIICSLILAWKTQKKR